ncbi:hypothetical protein HPB50_004452 [Hyalomma asiaticum]|uniref:Uncharacterized protein n=1 Tax=Hyalomma asiaticum TaxID=266040 RepID=A0ACB7TCE0_HYAAI|nr:hypothetical protein HPB50_004452 [Hyalomma asiaticum]
MGFGSSPEACPAPSARASAVRAFAAARASVVPRWWSLSRLVGGENHLNAGPPMCLAFHGASSVSGKHGHFSHVCLLRERSAIKWFYSCSALPNLVIGEYQPTRFSRAKAWTARERQPRTARREGHAAGWAWDAALHAAISKSI